MCVLLLSSWFWLDITRLKEDIWDLVFILKLRKKSPEPRFWKWLWSDSNHQSSDYKSSALTTRLPTAAAESTENLWYLYTVLINVYVASPDPDPNPKGGGQLPNPKSTILR